MYFYLCILAVLPFLDVSGYYVKAPSFAALQNLLLNCAPPFVRSVEVGQAERVYPIMFDTETLVANDLFHRTRHTHTFRSYWKLWPFILGISLAIVRLLHDDQQEHPNTICYLLSIYFNVETLSHQSINGIITIKLIQIGVMLKHTISVPISIDNDNNNSSRMWGYSNRTAEKLGFRRNATTQCGNNVQ